MPQMDDFLLDPYVSLYIGIFVQWGFVMAFLYSLANSINKKRKEALWLSLIMAISYLSSLFIDIHNISYIELFLFDLATISVIFFIRVYVNKSIIYTYLMCGLTVNSLLFFGMHLDVSVNENYSPWWFWSLYSIGINVIDFLMVAIFFINKDFLGLMQLQKLLDYKFKKER
jgi:hypothetical protein